MRRQWVRRLLQAVPTLLGMSVLIFGLVHLLPGDVTSALTGGEAGANASSEAALRKALGLNESIPLQYWHFLTGLLSGHLGKSFVTGQSIATIMGSAIPITLEIALLASLMAVVVGMPLGVLSALKRNSASDLLGRVAGLVGLSVPNFWLATLALLATSRFFGWVPALEWTALWSDPLENLSQAALPAFCVSFYLLAMVMRMTRASMLEVLHEGYVRTARAKGAPERVVIVRHALRNSLIPVVTVVGTQVGSLMGGVTIIEVIFGIPGVGNTLINAVYARDYPLIEVTAVFLAAVFVLLNLAVDLVYGLLDPRLRAST